MSQNHWELINVNESKLQGVKRRRVKITRNDITVNEPKSLRMIQTWMSQNHWE